MSATPKQVIYPMRYLRPLWENPTDAEAAFKSRLADFLGGGVDVVPLGRARAGIHLAAKFARLRTGNGSRVVMLPHTIPDVINMVRFAGCEPVFVDTLPDSTNVDFDHLTEVVDDKTCCVLITHYHVNQERIGDIRELCRQRDVMLFDDCAIALEGDYQGQCMGATTDASIFSMSGFKSLNYVWGGALATDREDIAAYMNDELATFPELTPAQYKEHMLAVLKYDLATRPGIFSGVTFPAIRRKSRVGSGQEALCFARRETEAIEETVLSRPRPGVLGELVRKLDTVGQRLAHRRMIAAVYDRFFADRRVAPEASDAVRAGSCFTFYPILVAPERRDRIYRQMIERGYHIGLSVYPNAHETEAFSSVSGRSRNISRLVRSMVSLPTHPKVTRDYAQALATMLSKMACHFVPAIAFV
ncbi:DegT/DnrJ/EryC1/StrS family aminotransferase [Neoaquamicrobium sediminum]|uniref:DegT/DnrJ/EryC1/StrS family aminotransferase n=1 Tax=Neoaquamicrobium sediminum TaxID=1849104 RepID=UPI003BA8D7A4